MNNITVRPMGMTNGPQELNSAKKVEGTGFDEVLKESMGAVNGQMQEAKMMAAGLVSGEHSNIHETMIAMEKSGIAFKLATKVQAKVIEAYQEVMRLQL